MNYLDLITAVLGLAYILFEYRASRWMWVVGIVMQTLGIVLYYQKGLYADCGMEFYYLAMSFYGLVRWTSSSPEGKGERGARITSLLRPADGGVQWLTLLGSGVVGGLLWLLIWWLLTTFTDSRVPIADSFTTAFSIVGIWMLAKKILEQWFVWIAVDAVTSALYFYKDIPFKASLYALYVVIAIFGYRKWRRMMKS